jgi:hypothetical protein
MMALLVLSWGKGHCRWYEQHLPWDARITNVLSFGYVQQIVGFERVCTLVTGDCNLLFELHV